MIRPNFSRITLASPLRTLCRRVKDQFGNGAEKAKGGLDHGNNSGRGKKKGPIIDVHILLSL